MGKCVKVFAVIGLLVTGGAGCARMDRAKGPWLELLDPARRALWQPAMGFERVPPWTLADGVFEGRGSWVCHQKQFSDFVLECEVLFLDSEGGIVIRADAGPAPWESGYELDVDWAGDRWHGHIHFPGWPKPYAGEALIEPGRWEHVRIEAVGPSVTVWLNGKRVIHFEDDRFLEGNICLEGSRGGVKYRKLRVRPL